MGFQVRPETHAALIQDPERLRRWAGRGHCRYFAGQPALLALARQAFELASARGSNYWMARLEAVTDGTIESALVKAPSALLSVPSRTFCQELLSYNRRRLLDDQ